MRLNFLKPKNSLVQRGRLLIKRRSLERRWFGIDSTLVTNYGYYLEIPSNYN